MSEIQAGPTITMITFGERIVEITYEEERDQSVHVRQARVLAVDVEVVDNEFQELYDAAQLTLDAALKCHRNPPDRFDR